MALDIDRPSVRPLGGMLAAEVSLDMTQMNEELFQFVNAAFLKYCVLVFRDQHLDPDNHVAFAKWFGEIFPYPEIALRGHPELARLENIPRAELADGNVHKATEFWHSDSTWLERPPAQAILAAMELPQAGGDTLIANQYAAYEALSVAMQEMLAPLRAVHHAPDYVYAGYGRIADEQVHPAVVAHPETGRKVLYVNVNAVRRFEGMSEDESRGLLQFLFTHQVQPQFVYRHRWQPGDVVMWDNRCTQHYAVDDYGDAPRVHVRASLIGTRPAVASS